MSRFWSVAAAALSALTFIVLLRYSAQWAVENIADPEPIVENAARLQLVSDEQSVGLVQPGTALAARFAVANSGSERLIVRQAGEACCGNAPVRDFSIAPGESGEVVARLMADDLAGRGFKHVRFYTSDPEYPELWLTVRGTLAQPPAEGWNEEAPPISRSILVEPYDSLD